MPIKQFIVPFRIERGELRHLTEVVPSGTDYKIRLKGNQHWDLSPSGKTLYLIQEDTVLRRFQVNKTMFLLEYD